MNRAQRRLARMTRRAEPSALELRANIQKRAGRLGLPYSHGTSASTSKTGADSLAVSQLGHGLKSKGNGRNGNNNNNGAASATNTSTTDTTDSTQSTTDGPGLAAGNIEAAASGGLTAPQNPTADDSLGLSDEANDVGYVAAVQIGTPPRDFQILMDSGSADFWVGGEGCQEVTQNGRKRSSLEARRNRNKGNGNGNGNANATANGGNNAAAATNCGNHVFLGPQSSSSLVDKQQQFQVSYGSGAVAGEVISDDVSIAGLQLNAHTFGVALIESVQFSSDSTQFDGLMGLAQSVRPLSRI